MLINAIHRAERCPHSAQYNSHVQRLLSSYHIRSTNHAFWHGDQNHPLPRFTRRVLPMTAGLACGGRTTRRELGGLSDATPAWLHTRKAAI
jgi:hypothetical protein